MREEKEREREREKRERGGSGRAATHRGSGLGSSLEKAWSLCETCRRGMRRGGAAGCWLFVVYVVYVAGRLGISQLFACCLFCWLLLLAGFGSGSGSATAGSGSLVC